MKTQKRSICRVQIGPRSEELLSYLIGLAPVGTEFILHLPTVMADLEFTNKTTFYNRLTPLINKGLVKKSGSSRIGKYSLYVVSNRNGL